MSGTQGEDARPATGLDSLAVVRALFSTLRRVLARSNSEVRGAGTALAAWSICDAITMVLVPYATMRLVEAIVEAQKTGEAGSALRWVAVEAAVLMVRTVAAKELVLWRTVLEARTLVALNAALLEKSCAVPYPNFENTAFVDELAHARESTNSAAPFVVEFFTCLKAALIFLGCLTLLLVASFWVAPVVVLSALPTYWFELRYARRSFALDADNVRLNRRRWYLEWLLTSEMNAKEVRALEAGSWLVALYREIFKPVAESKVRFAKSYRFGSLASAAAGLVGQYGLYAYVVVQTGRGELSLGNMILFAMSFQACTGALGLVLGSVATTVGRELRVRRLLDFLAGSGSQEAAAVPEPHLRNAPELVLEDVWFSYPGAREPVLRGVNLRVRAGERLALVGSNGAGKTTLVKVLLGLYEHQRGKILIDGVDVSSRSMAWRLQNIGVIFQDFSRFQFSVRQNVAIGWLPHAADESKIWSTLQHADADALVHRLPAGLETALGPAFGGHDLSGGQWQRIALARLFMRESRLWVLDEPSAAMDPETEERTFRRFREWTDARTALIISHRLSSIQMADRVAVIHDGEIVELGSHEDLVRRGGRYTQLFPRQDGVARAERLDAPPN